MNTIKYMLCALHDAGFTDGEIFRRTGIPQPTVTRLRNGQHFDTSYIYGKKIEALFNEQRGENKAAKNGRQQKAPVIDLAGSRGA